MKKILLCLLISVFGVMQAQVLLSHESGIVPYGTEILIMTPNPTDTIWYAWDGHNPESIFGDYVIGGGTMTVPEPNENEPYWSHFPSMAEDTSQLFSGQAEWFELPDPADYLSLNSVLKTNVLRIKDSHGEYSYFFIDPQTLSRHHDIPIVNIAIDEEDGFGDKGILVPGNCLIDSIRGTITEQYHFEESMVDSIEFSVEDAEYVFQTSEYITIQNLVFEEGDTLVLFEAFLDKDSVYVFISDTSGQNNFSLIVDSISLDGNIFFLRWSAIQGGGEYSYEYIHSQWNEPSDTNLCIANFAIHHNVFNRYPELDKTALYKDIGIHIHHDDFMHNGSATIRMAGNYSRQDPAKPLRIKFPKDNALEYDLYGRGIEKYRTVYLRKWGSTASYSMINDWLSHTLIASQNINDLSPQSGRPCIVYINGEYWGLYLMQERADKYHIENYHNVDNDYSIRYQWARWSETGVDPYGAHRDSIESWMDQIKILRYVDTVDIQKAGLVNEVSQYLNLESFFLSRNFCASSNRGDIGNSRIWKATYNDEVHEMIKDFDFAFNGSPESHTWQNQWYDPDTINDVFLNNAKIQRELFNTLLGNDTVRYLHYNTTADLRTMVMNTDTLSKFITLLTDSILPQLNQNYDRWGHLPRCSPDSLSYLWQVQNFHNFAQVRPGYIDEFFIEDFEEITGTTNMYLEMKHICESGDVSIFNGVKASTVPVKGYDTPRWRHAYDVPVPLTYTGDLLYWIVNNDTIYEIDNIWIDVHKDSTYYITGVFGCKTGHDAQDRVRINEVVASQDAIIETPFGGFEDYVELFNTNNDTINLKGLYFSDKADNLTKYKVEQDLHIPPKEYILIWCDDRSNLGPEHTNFKLNKDHEYFIIFDGEDVIDSIGWYEEIPRNVSLSLCDDEWIYLIPSPLESNPCQEDEEEDEEGEEILSLHNLHKDDINIFPNPTHGNIIITGNWNHVDIINIEGKKIKPNMNGEEISLSMLPTGVYFITIYTDSEVIHHKVIKN